jgi:hypothetical protein
MARVKSEWLSARGKSEELFKGIVDAVLARGGSDDDLDRARRSSALCERIANVIMGLDRASLRVLPSFRAVTIGALPSHEAYRAALKAGHKISDYADQILSRITVAPAPVTLDLVVLTIKEITGKDKATRVEIYEAALARGDVDLCPAEVGPALRLQYGDQPMNEWLFVAMEPLTVSGGGLGLFGVVRDLSGPRLCGHGGGLDDVWTDDFGWLFVRRK